MWKEVRSPEDPFHLYALHSGFHHPTEGFEFWYELWMLDNLYRVLIVGIVVAEFKYTKSINTTQSVDM